MGILRDFERRLGGAVEGFFARAFRSGLQPVELAKALQRYAADYQQVGIDGVFVPNVYRFSLSPEDMDRFRDFVDTLARELADVVGRTAGERTWHLPGPVRIELVMDADVPVGTYELRGKVDPSPPPAPSDTAGPVKDPRTSGAGAGAHGPGVAGAGVSAGSPASGRSAGGGQSDRSRSVLTPASGAALKLVDSGQEFHVPERALIGRLPECDITIDDPSVSRRHAKISRTDGRWVVEDLGSTNGVRVNDRQVAHAELGDGDRLQLGSIRLAFTLER